MTVSQVVFLLLTVVVLVSAINVVTTRNLMHAALFLILSFFCVAGYYVLLDAGFFAAAQLMVYIGAISILFIFAAMLTRGTTMTQRGNSQWQAALGLSAVLFVILAIMLLPGRLVIGPLQLGAWRINSVLGGTEWPMLVDRAGQLAPVPAEYITLLGLALGDFGHYGGLLLLAGVLLMLSMIGSIWVARERRVGEVKAERARIAAEYQAELESAGKEQAALPGPAVAADAHH